MKIRWSNIVVLLLIVFALVVGIKAYRQITEFLSNMGNIGSGHSSHEQTFGLIAFGLILVTIVAIVRILQDNGRNKP